MPDDEVSEVEESRSSSGSEAEEEVYSEASEVDDKPPTSKVKPANKGKLASHLPRFDDHYQKSEVTHQPIMVFYVHLS